MFIRLHILIAQSRLPAWSLAAIAVVLVVLAVNSTFVTPYLDMQSAAGLMVWSSVFVMLMPMIAASHFVLAELSKRR